MNTTKRILKIHDVVMYTKPSKRIKWGVHHRWAYDANSNLLTDYFYKDKDALAKTYEKKECIITDIITPISPETPILHYVQFDDGQIAILFSDEMRFETKQEKTNSRKQKFVVVFTSYNVVTELALKKEEAIILAQAEQIKKGRSYMVNFVKDKNNRII